MMGLPPLVSSSVNADGSVTVTFRPENILPSYNLPANLYHSEAVQWKKKKNLLQFANVLHVIGGILAAFAGKVGVLGTVLYFLGFPVVVFVWVWLVVLPFLKRKRAVGGPGAGGVTTVGYKFLPVVLSILWYVAFFFAAFIVFASVASKPFSGPKGRGKTKMTGFVLALFQWAMIGIMETALITFQSGATYSDTAIDLPDCVVQHVPGGGTAMITTCPTTIRFDEIESLASAISSESFKTVSTSTRGNVKTTITRTWTRNVLWVCFKRKGESTLHGFPVSAVPPPQCGGYCCLTLERRAELGVINATAKQILNLVSARVPGVTAQADQLVNLIDNTVKI